MLEPPAFEEGILDRYPVFLSIVLNHLSDDSPEFSHAVNCLRLLFEMLGMSQDFETYFIFLFFLKSSGFTTQCLPD